MDLLTESLEWSSALVERTRTSVEPEVFRVGPSLIHRRTGRIESPGGARQLRAKELDLVAHLYEHATTTFTREELLERVWNCHPDLLTRTVDQTVATLRQKIEMNPQRPQFLQTVYGVGYRLVL